MGKRRRVQLVQIEVDGEMVAAKECTKCGVVMVLDEFPRQKGGVAGKASRCRMCKAEANRKYREENQGKVQESQRKWLDKNQNYFIKYYKEHKERLREASKEHYSENRELYLEKAKEWRKRNPEKHRDKNRNWREKNHKKWLEVQQAWREKNRDYFSTWRKENPEKVREIRQRRRARKAGLPDDMTDRRWEEIVGEDFSGACALTGESDDLTMEHFIPLSIHHGGTYDGNLYPMVKSLNSSKWKTNPFEWIKRPDISERVPADRWNALVLYLAEKNGLTVEEFREFVYWCFDNPRTPAQAAKDTKRGITSLDLWRDSKLRKAANE